MGGTIFTQMGFVDFMVSHRPRKSSFLREVDKVVDWGPIEKILNRKRKKRASADGRHAYPALALFKMLLIQRWYNLSDPGLEEAVDDRISSSFYRFIIGEKRTRRDYNLPFPQRIGQAKRDLYEKLLDKINEQFQSGQLLVRSGAIVNAGLISSATRPRKMIDVMPEDKKEEEGVVLSDSKLTYSDDIEAAWVRKGNQTHCGYKMHWPLIRTGLFQVAMLLLTMCQIRESL